MKNKIISLAAAAACGIFISFFSVLGLVTPDGGISRTERRKLADPPDLSVKNIVSGKFMSDFETYALDNFPFREQFRKLKAVTSYFVMMKKDNNGICLTDGYASKLDCTLNEKSVRHACDRFSYINSRYLSGNAGKVWFSVIPDKNYYLSRTHDIPVPDYGRMISMMKDDLDFAEYIDITGTLDTDCFYKTDTHWKQEKITGTAKVIAERTGVTLAGEYTPRDTGIDFYGVYYGQAALPMSPDRIVLLENDAQNEYIVYDYEKNRDISIYNTEALSGMDPYEVYLYGPRSLITIENPKSESDRELVIFRDSFAGSLVPLLAEGYRKITLADIRYMHPDVVGRFVDFKDKDVVFLYSTLVLNNSETIK